MLAHRMLRVGWCELVGLELLVPRLLTNSVMSLRVFVAGAGFLCQDCIDGGGAFLLVGFAVSCYSRLVCEDSEVRQPSEFLPGFRFEELAVSVAGFV